jgi:hypothetical protein
MNTPKYTPGPWFLFRISKLNIIEIGDTLISLKKYEDARLIASAPDMLDTLIAIQPLLTAYDADAWTKASKLVAATVAKAKGE